MRVRCIPVRDAFFYAKIDWKKKFDLWGGILSFRCKKTSSNEEVLVGRVWYLGD